MRKFRFKYHIQSHAYLGDKDLGHKFSAEIDIEAENVEEAEMKLFTVLKEQLYCSFSYTLMNELNQKSEASEIYILYSTDAWHTRSSQEMLGIFSDRERLNEYLLKMSKDVGLTDYDMELLQSIHQTQGLDTNYLVETQIINPKYEN